MCSLTSYGSGAYGRCSSSLSHWSKELEYTMDRLLVHHMAHTLSKTYFVFSEIN